MTDVAERPAVLIVGGGFIGKTMADAVRSAGRTPLVVTRSGPWTGPDAEVVLGDASAADVLRPLVGRVAHVMLAHSGLNPAESEAAPLEDLAAILGPIQALFEALVDAPGVGVTHFSSGGTVYGDAPVVPTPESTELAPRSFYGLNRWTAEQYLARHASDTNPVTVLRCSNLYGPFQRGGGSQGLIAVVADRLRRGESITLFGDGRTERDYVLAADVCRAALALAFDGAARHPWQVLNCGSGEATETEGLVRRIGGLLGIEPEIDWQPDRGFDVRRSVLDIEQLRRSIDFTPTPLEAGLRIALGLEASSEA